MKNGKKAISLMLTALTVVSLSSCFDVTSGDEGEILNYTYNGQSLKITTQDIVDKYLSENKTEHAKAYYDALYEVVVRANFEKGGLLEKYKSAVESTANQSVLNAKDEADNSGKSWHDYLVEKGYNDDTTNDEQKEKEFYLDQLFTAMETRVTDEFNNQFNTWKMDDVDSAAQQKYNTLWGENGFINEKLPYHVKHILVKVDATETTGKYSRGHISSANVEKLYQTITSLVNGDEFGEVAKNYSDDPGSASKGGEHIMNIDTGFVDEFQMGIYAYDTLLSAGADGKSMYANEPNYAEKKEKLNLPGATSDNDGQIAKEIKDLGASFIPYGVVEKMYEDKDKEKTKDGISIYNGDADYFPRNIYFNKYFQNRNVAFITPEAAWQTSDLTLGTGDSGYRQVTDNVTNKKVFTDINDKGNYATKKANDSTLSEEQLKNFHEIKFTNGTSKNVLCDNEGNPILVVRNQESSAGIHLIVIERSAFDETDKHFDAKAYIEQGAKGSEEEVKNHYATKLNEYYATDNPKKKDGYDETTNKPYYVNTFPGYDSGAQTGYIPKKTFVQNNIVTEGDKSKNDVYHTVSEYNARVQTIKDELDKMKEITKFSKYEWLNDDEGREGYKTIKLNDEKTQALVEKYIDTTIDTTTRNNLKAIQDRWYQYAAALKQQTNERKYNLLPEILAADYGNVELYKKGQPGYNPKYDSINGNTSNPGVSEAK